MSDQQFAFLIGLGCGVIVGALMMWPIMIRLFVVLIRSRPETKEAFEKVGMPKL